jgi:hypothetical protein
MRMLRLPSARPVSLRIPSRHGYFPYSICFRSPRVMEFLPLRLGVGLPVSPLAPARSRERSQSDLSSSQGTLFSAFALLSDPGRFSTPSPLRRFDAAPAVMTTKAPTLVFVSRLNHTALAPAPYASCRHHCRLRNVRFRLVASLYRVGLLAHWVPA